MAQTPMFFDLTHNQQQDSTSGKSKRTDRQATLVLEDGSVYVGQSFGYEESIAGEVVFNTGMVRTSAFRCSAPGVCLMFLS